METLRIVEVEVGLSTSHHSVALSAPSGESLTAYFDVKAGESVLTVTADSGVSVGTFPLATVVYIVATEYADESPAAHERAEKAEAERDAALQWRREQTARAEKAEAERDYWQARAEDAEDDPVSAFVNGANTYAPGDRVRVHLPAGVEPLTAGGGDHTSAFADEAGTFIDATVVGPLFPNLVTVKHPTEGYTQHVDPSYITRIPKES